MYFILHVFAHYCNLHFAITWCALRGSVYHFHHYLYISYRKDSLLSISAKNPYDIYIYKPVRFHHLIISKWDNLLVTTILTLKKTNVLERHLNIWKIRSVYTNTNTDLVDRDRHRGEERVENWPLDIFF